MGYPMESSSPISLEERYFQSYGTYPPGIKGLNAEALLKRIESTTRLLSASRDPEEANRLENELGYLQDVVTTMGVGIAINLNHLEATIGPNIIAVENGEFDGQPCPNCPRAEAIEPTDTVANGGNLKWVRIGECVLPVCCKANRLEIVGPTEPKRIVEI